MKKISAWKTKGMNRDLSVSAFNPEFSFENMNLRLSTNEGNTLLSWVNEKSTGSITLYDYDSPSTEVSIEGHVLGTAVMNKYLILFVTKQTSESNKDRIYRLEYKNGVSLSMQMTVKRLYAGNLGFSVLKPLETFTSYEREDIQKVYWTDGVKQPRVINICKTYASPSLGDAYNPFDFVPILKLSETVKITKILGASGMFAPGVIQYALTYYNKYGQESNIFYTSPLLYISHRDRGGSPEDKVDNAFKITVNDIDSNFDFIRIYSIQRTSLNGTPICKRVQDVSLRGSGNLIVTNVTYTDTGTSGDTIDPTELLFKGGEVVSVETMEQKDNTMFFGGINVTRNNLASENWANDIRKLSVDEDERTIYPIKITGKDYKYSSQLTAYDANGKSVPCGGFKTGEYYRCGIQFQHESGVWSDPFYVNGTETLSIITHEDVLQTNTPSCYIDPAGDTAITLPTFKVTIGSTLRSNLINAGYRKARPVVVFPDINDREVLCQAVVCPTLFTNNHREEYSSTHQEACNDLYAQSSWFFRAPSPALSSHVAPSGAVVPTGTVGPLPYTKRTIEGSDPSPYNTGNIREVEIWGDYKPDNKFQIDRKFLTLHSPDIEFDDRMWLVDYGNTKYRVAGITLFKKTFSDIEIQTETPSISSAGSGFVHKSFVEDAAYGIVSGLFYDDFIVDDHDKNEELDSIRAYDKEKSPVKWMVNLWHKNGSLNNDFNRPATLGTRTALLRKKVISNLRYAETTLGAWLDNSYNDFYYATYEGLDDTPAVGKWTPQLFSSSQIEIIKVMEKVYQGNVDTMLIPDDTDGNYFAHEANSVKSNVGSTKFTSNNIWKTFAKQESADNNDGGCWHYSNSVWTKESDVKIGDFYADLANKKEPVRMKYKSTPHLVCRVPDSSDGLGWSEASLSIIDITREVNPSTRFGGKSEDALKENIWIPCGEPVILPNTGSVDVLYEYGDTYFQRWDCLKTYPFTKEDPNQVVEIGSFMLETRVNIDGRYDRNRGQANNLNMSPENFNLYNPVYSQTDNFFSYRIKDNDFYTSTIFPNQIAWSKTKTSGSDVDLWTNVTLASAMEMDGDKGKITKLARLNDQLLCFQDKGISQILYNENVQIATSAGVPIELANSGKVTGKRYVSNTVGCSNKWSIVHTPGGIYFMDSNDQSIYLIGDGLKNISQQSGLSTWCKQNIPTPACAWNPGFPSLESKTAFTAGYDKANQDVLFINANTALAWSEKFGAFTSFYDYGGTQFFCNLADTGVWVKQTVSNVTLWKHQAGNGYCNFFGTNKPYWMTLVGNPEPQMDKIFTNMEFRACVEGDGELSQSTGRFTFTLPFNSLETWNEYQHGYTTIENKSGHSAMVHDFASSSLKRKFRIWRCDIPRNNVPIPNAVDAGYSTDAALGISRYIVKPNDRMRNPWLYLKLFKAAPQTGTLPKVEIHDLVMTYFD